MTTTLFWLFGVGSVLSGWRVFRTSSMVRAAYWLLASFLGVAGILILLGADFLGLVLILMMAGEMTIMAVFMVMFMMNPAGLNPMVMVHQHRAAIAAGAAGFVGLGAAGLFGAYPDHPRPATHQPTAELGIELLGESMLTFETAGVVLLATMVGAIAIASRRGRFGEADTGSEEPPLPDVAGTSSAMEPEAMDHAGHGGHG